MADDELIIPIDKAFWPRGVMRGLTPVLRSLGDKHGNLVIAAVPNKHIMVKGPADRIEEVKAPLRELFEEHFPDAPVPEELGGGDGEAGNEGYTQEEIEAWEREQEEKRKAEEAAKAEEAKKASAADQMKAKMAERKAKMEDTSPKASPQQKPAQSPKQTPPKASPQQKPAQSPKQTPAPEPARSGVSSWFGGSKKKEEPAAKAKAVPAGPPPKPVAGRKQPRPAAMVAPDLLWECVRKNSSFIRKPNKELKRPFSAEPCNLLGVHSLKFSGVASEAVNVRPVKEGKKESIQLVQSHAKNSRQRRPKSAIVTTGLHKCPKRGLARLERELDAKFYRRDLLNLAKIKYDKVQKSFKTKKRHLKSRRNKN